jgi:hypothetical protein
MKYRSILLILALCVGLASAAQVEQGFISHSANMKFSAEISSSQEDEQFLTVYRLEAELREQVWSRSLVKKLGNILDTGTYRNPMNVGLLAADDASAVLLYHRQPLGESELLWIVTRTGADRSSSKDD